MEAFASKNTFPFLFGHSLPLTLFFLPTKSISTTQFSFPFGVMALKNSTMLKIAPGDFFETGSHHGLSSPPYP